MMPATEDTLLSVSSEWLSDMVCKANEDLDDRLDICIYPESTITTTSEKMMFQAMHSVNIMSSPASAADPIEKSITSIQLRNKSDGTTWIANADGSTQRVAAFSDNIFVLGHLTNVTVVVMYLQ